MAPDDFTSLPGPAVPETSGEIDGFEAELRRFQSGGLTAERWRAFRLAHGIYGQRQDGVQMVRVKIPAGVLDAAQLRRLADVTEEYSNGIAHLTTRQDVQLYYVSLPRVPALLRALTEVGLTTREACGNSVRNVTACPLTGFIAEESFDVGPYAQATYAFLVRNAFCQQMARKFKISFSACPEDCAAAAIHDIGALGRVQTIDGRTRHGFRIVVGGGLGPTPYLAKTLEDFVPVEDLLTTIKSVLRVYSDLGNRTMKGKARLKFVVNRLGIEAFRERVRATHAALTDEERDEAQLTRYLPPGARPEHGEARAARELEVPGGDDRFCRWHACSVRAHKVPERAVVTVMVPLGDLDATQLRALARIAAVFGSDHARVARDQNLVFPTVRCEDLQALHAELDAAGLGESGVGTALDVTSCPGADTCRLGITSSKGLARAIRAELAPLGANGGLPILRDLTIKISGCPNSCGQHHVAGIGFHGVVRSLHGSQAPAYQIHVGGRTEDGKATIGRALVKIPARSVPTAVTAFVTLFRAERSGDESFADFAGRQSDERLRAILAPIAEASVDPADAHRDWGSTEKFSTDDLGTCECAGASEDATVDPFDGYRTEEQQTGRFIERRQWADAMANLNRSQYTLARVLLGALGKRPESDYEVTCELRAHVIDRGYASELWNEMHDEIGSALRARHPDPGAVASIHARSQELLTEASLALPLLARRRAQVGTATDIPG